MRRTPRICLFLLFLLSGISAQAQEPGLQGIGSRMQRMGGGLRRQAGGAGTDSLRRRDKLEDSITISYRYLDSAGSYRLDSSVTDFTRRYPLPPTFIHLGNTGTAARSLLFQPILNTGFDPGFHAFDVYKWRLEQVRFFQTTRPYSELNYLLGSRVEQIIEVMHTQNLRPSWNVAFQYRLINAPGFFQNQRTNHNNYLLTSRFQSRNLRYSQYLVFLGNKILTAENGGIVDTSDILNDPIYKERFNIATYLGGSNPFSSNFFGSKITTGNRYNEFTVLLRQQYDLGRKDSVVTDTTVIPLFYPRVRFEHTLRYDRNKYVFQDFVADSAYYHARYGLALRPTGDSVLLIDRWKVLSNDLSMYTFPDARNLQQFLRIGVQVQQIIGELAAGRKTFFNTAGHAEYRNRTRNGRWDLSARGQLFFTGFNAGDYEAHVGLGRQLGRRTGTLELGFSNVSRTASFLFDPRSSFFLMRNSSGLKKENHTRLSAAYLLPGFRLRLQGTYFLTANYTYLTDYRNVKQAGLFNVLQVSAHKSFRIGRRWNWHADLWFQQRVGDAQLNLPAFFTRHRIAYEGDLGFRNLTIAMGAEVRYRAAYRADDYSPALGQFFFQDSILIRNKMPDISLYAHFRIRPFKAFVRIENLNTARRLPGQGLSFTNNNLIAPGYALPGLQFRLGVYWSFVN